jgi:hypothetical protein
LLGAVNDEDPFIIPDMIIHPSHIKPFSILDLEQPPHAAFPNKSAEGKLAVMR